ncbi:hypothetical protein H8D73_01100, partial [bacterium]|nr:hypothetical protein [bacterium]
DFVGNHAPRGGGINCRGGSTPSIQGGVFRENTATDGGGVYCREASAPNLRGVLLEWGSATSGGGLYAEEAYPEMTDCIFAWNVATGADYYDGGGAVHLHLSDAIVDSCAFIENSGVLGGAFHVRDCMSTSLSATTLAGNTADQGSAIYCRESSASAENCIVAFGVGEAVTCVSAFVEFTCSDVFGNSGGDWVGCIASQLGYAGNICADPLFCGGGVGDIAEDYMIQDGSPCAAANSPCGAMGRWGVGCASTIVESRSWGGIKAMYR